MKETEEFLPEGGSSVWLLGQTAIMNCKICRKMSSNISSKLPITHTRLKCVVENSQFALDKVHKKSVTFNLCYFCPYYDRTDQSWQEAKWERVCVCVCVCGGGGGSWKVLESGFELGMPIAQWHCMSAYAAHSAIGADMKYIFKVIAKHLECRTKILSLTVLGKVTFKSNALHYCITP